MPITPIRQKIVDYAKSYAGVSCATPEGRSRYVQLLDAQGTDDMTSQMQAYFVSPNTSGCALVVRGFWRDNGLLDVELTQSYRIAYAIKDIIDIAKRWSAWVAWHELGDYELQPGDVVLINKPEHVYTVTAVHKTSDGYLIESIDGGQRDPSTGDQCITAKKRRWTKRGLQRHDAVMYREGAYSTRRMVMGVVALDVLNWPPYVTPAAPPPC